MTQRIGVMNGAAIVLGALIAVCLFGPSASCWISARISARFTCACRTRVFSRFPNASHLKTCPTHAITFYAFMFFLLKLPLLCLALLQSNALTPPLHVPPHRLRPPSSSIRSARRSSTMRSPTRRRSDARSRSLAPNWYASCVWGRP